STRSVSKGSSQQRTDLHRPPIVPPTHPNDGRAIRIGHLKNAPSHAQTLQRGTNQWKISAGIGLSLRVASYHTGMRYHPACGEFSLANTVHWE
ncbi:MAG: hypothetical protein AAFN70_12385, partial [Planctomycetota bacterium]